MHRTAYAPCDEAASMAATTERCPGWRARAIAGREGNR